MGNLKHYQLAAAGLAILGAALIASLNALRADAADSELKYAGTTTPQTFDGTQGIFAPHRACAAKIQKAVWCTTEMTRDAGPHPTAETPPEGGAWIQAAPHGQSPLLYVDALDGARFSDQLNCRRWGAGLAVGVVTFGTIIRTEPTLLGPRVVTETAECGTPESFRPAACCSTRPLQKFFPATPGPPIRPKPGE